MIKIKPIILTILIFYSIISLANIRYVNFNATGLNNGTSWSNAFISLQSAFDIAVSGDQIWVTAGTYYPSKDPFGNASPTDPRDKTFYITNGVEYYGGFAGTESTLNQRTIANITILSGDIGVLNTTSDNCYHVLISVNDGNLTKMNSFTITLGNAYGAAGGITVETKNINHIYGGGMYNVASSPILSNVTFFKNHGGDGSGFGSGGAGGMYNDASSPTITNAIFNGNDGVVGSGGMQNKSSSPVLNNVIFSGNLSKTGGGMSNESSSSPILTNCTFYANHGLIGGGAIYNSSSTLSVKNCVFWDNKSNFSTVNANADILNSLSTVTVNFSSLQLANNTSNYLPADFPTIGANNNIFANDPKFVNVNNIGGSDDILMTTDDGLSIKSNSPCINTGTASGAATTDITGFNRIANPEMGAYEYNPGTCSFFTNNIAYVNVIATGLNNGTSWANAFNSLELALNATRICGVKQIWIAKGTYMPSADALGLSNPVDSRNKTFFLVDSVELYGGFAGSETAINLRSGGNITILSGDIGSASLNTDNCYHVVLSVNFSNATKLDGLTIADGNANGTSSIKVGSAFVYQDGGGGLVNLNASTFLNEIIFSNNNSKGNGGGLLSDNSSPTLTNVTFMSNAASNGGGMSNSNSSAKITKVLFLKNKATNSGGGLYNYTSNSNLLNIVFSSNSALTGGGVYNSGLEPSFTNVLFSLDSATINGGGMYNDYSSPVLTNVTFSRNTASNIAGAMFNTGSSTLPIIKNCVFWENSKAGDISGYGSDIYNSNSILTASFSSMQLVNNSTNYTTSGFPNIATSNNLFAMNPAFINNADPDGTDNVFMTADDGMAIPSSSPCANVGTTIGAPVKDIRGYSRDANTDMGAYEFSTASKFNDIKAISISIYPNPVDEILTIETDISDNAKVKIYNVFGQMVACEKLIIQHSIIDVSNYPIGMYFMKIIVDNKVISTQKLIKL